MILLIKRYICLFVCIHRNSNGSTPLHLTAGNGHRDIVAYLLQHPAINAVKF